MIEFWRYSSRNRDGHSTHPLTLARRNLILELWCAGKTKEEIALIVDVDVDTISSHFQAARRAGDARAVIRHPATKLALERAGVENSVREVAGARRPEGMVLLK